MRHRFPVASAGLFQQSLRLNALNRGPRTIEMPLETRGHGDPVSVRKIT